MALLNMNELIDNYDTSTFMSIQLKRIEHDTLIYQIWLFDQGLLHKSNSTLHDAVDFLDARYIVA